MARSGMAGMLPLVGFSLAFAAVGLSLTDPYHQLIFTLVAIWAVMGLSWNVLGGYAGLVSFGHAAFFGLGAYTVGIAMADHGISPWLTIPATALVGAVAGVIIGLPTFRLRGHYFALAMLAYPLALLYTFAWLGFQEVSLPMKRDDALYYMQFDDNRVLGLLSAATLFISLLITRRVETSRFGRKLLAIKQDEAAAQAAGIDVRRCKLAAIALSGAMASVAGGFYAVIMLVVTPGSVFGLLASAQALIVAMFGGVGTMWGPVIGALVLIPLGDVLHAELAGMLPGIQGVIFGAAIIAAMLLAPEGIYWRVADAWSKRSGAGRASDAAASRPFPKNPAAAAQPEPPVRGAALEVAGLTKAFGGLKAVNGASFLAEPGEIVGIIGPNGAGKTSLFNLLSGFVKPDGGSVLLDGQPIVGLAPDEICRRGVGRTFQVARPFRRMTVAANLAVGAYAIADDDEAVAGRVESVLLRTGLWEQAASLPSALTAEQVRLLEIGRALAGRPRLLLLDETLAGLGTQEVEKVIETIRSIARAGVTVLIIEHTMQAMVRLADRFVVLDHGAIIADGKPADVMADPRVIEAYLGRKWAARA